MTLREAAARLTAIAAEVRDIAARVDGIDTARWAAARDLRATAFVIEAKASAAERAGSAAGEPDPGDTSWVATAAPGELVESFGK